MTAPRLGPRPLPLHLASAATLWMSSRAALPLLKAGLLPWRPELLPAASALRQSLEPVAAEAFAAAVDVELRARGDELPERPRPLPPPSLPPRPRRPAGALAGGVDAAPRLWRWRRAAGAGGALADQPRLYPRSRRGQEPAALSRRRGAPAAAGRLGQARTRSSAASASPTTSPAGSRPAAAAGGGGGGRRLSPCWAIAWAGCWRWRWPSGGPTSSPAWRCWRRPWDFHAERAGQARLLGEIAEPLTRSFAALGEVPVDRAADAVRRPRSAAGAAQILALRRAGAGLRRGARLRCGRGLAQ